jgi:hypothetical protein
MKILTQGQLHAANVQAPWNTRFLPALESWCVSRMYLAVRNSITQSTIGCFIDNPLLHGQKPWLPFCVDSFCVPMPRFVYSLVKPIQRKQIVLKRTTDIIVQMRATALVGSSGTVLILQLSSECRKSEYTLFQIRGHTNTREKMLKKQKGS